jgi:hypothetical protein
MKRRVDRERIERADRECKLVLDAERQAREAKTARLKEQRLAQSRTGVKPSQTK